MSRAELAATIGIPTDRLDGYELGKARISVTHLFDDARRPSLVLGVGCEIPPPRWTTYDAVRNDIPLPDGVPAEIRERTWTSPIWYAPEG